MSAARIAVLGRLGIEREDRDAPARGLPGRRAELVFAYLTVEHRRTVSRDELADALWPGVLPDSWAAALRGVVSDVRRFLEDGGLDPAEVLAAGRGGYQLRLPTPVVVDVDEAREAVAAARAELKGGHRRRLLSTRDALRRWRDCPSFRATRASGWTACEPSSTRCR